MSTSIDKVKQQFLEKVGKLEEKNKEVAETCKIASQTLEKTKQQLEREQNEKREIQERFAQQKSLL